MNFLLPLISMVIVFNFHAPPLYASDLRITSHQIQTSEKILGFIYDSCHCLTPKEVAEIDASQYRPIDHLVSGQHQVIWNHLRVSNETTEAETLVLKFWYNRLWLSEVYQQTADGFKMVSRTGISVPFNEKEGPSSEQLHELKLNAGEVSDYYIRSADITANFHHVMDFSLKRNGRHLLAKDLLFFTIYGSMMLLAIANLGFFLLFRIKDLWLNVLSTFFILLGLMSQNATLYTILPEFLVVGGWQHYAIVSMAILCLNLHTKFVVEHSSDSFWLKRIHYLVTGLSFLFGVCSVFATTRIYIETFDVFLASSLLFVCFSAAYGTHADHIISRFNIIAWSGLTLGVIGLLLATNGFIPYNLFTTNMANLGALWFVVAISSGHVYQVYLYRELAKKTLESQNIDLSHLVESRNKALEVTKGHLKKARDRIIEQAHAAGMAEVASISLHNMGNLINTVNINLRELASQLDRSQSTNFVDNLNRFIDEKGHQRIIADQATAMRIINGIQLLAKANRNEVESSKKILVKTMKNVSLMVRSMETQKRLTHKKAVLQDTNLKSLTDKVVELIRPSIESLTIEIKNNVPLNLTVHLEQYKLYSSLLNLLQNAVDSLRQVKHGRVIEMTAISHSSGITLSIIDNGIGFDKETAKRMYQYGFTTKENGTGFGLHDAYSSLNSMGCVLKLESQGPLLGARAILELRNQTLSRKRK